MEISFDIDIDKYLLNAEIDQPHIYQAFSSFINIALVVFYQTGLFLKFTPEQRNAYRKEINDSLEAFKLELEDDSDEDISPSYKGTESARFIASAYIDLRYNDGQFLTHYPEYETYIKSKGKAKLGYKDAIAILPPESSPFYKATKDYWIDAKNTLADIRAVRVLLRKLFKLIPKDVYRYEDIKKLYNELRNMYAYETVFNFYYM